MRQTPALSPGDRFDALWLRRAPRVMAYALRHTDADVAQDVVSEVFLVAWRRLDSVPADPLPWLLVVARNVFSNQHRSRDRQGRVASELQRLRAVAEPAPAAAVAGCSVPALHTRLFRARRRLRQGWETQPRPDLETRPSTS